MTENGRQAAEGFSVRRIVVALDGSAHAQTALEAAAALAARLQAEIEAVFVEDIDLVNLAGLPFGSEFSLTTGARRPFDTKALEDQIRAEVMRARRAVEAATRRGHVRYTFRVTRGQVAAEVVAAAGAADLLILGSASRAVGYGFRPGRVALAAAERSPRSVLLLRSGARLVGRPLVAYDGSPGAEKALDAAGLLARLTGSRVHVLIAEPDSRRAGALRDAASRRLGSFGVPVVFLAEIEATLEVLCLLVARTEADVLVISADDPKLAGEGRHRLLQSVPCPLLLVR